MSLISDRNASPVLVNTSITFNIAPSWFQPATVHVSHAFHNMSDSGAPCASATSRAACAPTPARVGCRVRLCVFRGLLDHFPSASRKVGPGASVFMAPPSGLQAARALCLQHLRRPAARARYYEVPVVTSLLAG